MAAISATRRSLGVRASAPQSSTRWNADCVPIGVQLVTAYGREDIVIRVAAQLEHASPWAHAHPPACP